MSLNLVYNVPSSCLMTLQRCSPVVCDTDVPLLKVRRSDKMYLLEDMRLRAYREHQKKCSKIFCLDHVIRTRYARWRRSKACGKSGIDARRLDSYPHGSARMLRGL